MLFHYTAERDTLHAIARQTFDALRGGVIRVDVRRRYALAAVVEAHRDLEAPAHDGPARVLAVALRPVASVRDGARAPKAEGPT